MNWYTKEGLLYDDDKERWDFVVLSSPDCLKCAKALRKLRANATAEEVKEAKREGRVKDPEGFPPKE